MITPELSQEAGTLGWLLFFISNMSDLRASTTAHRMFYKWAKMSKKRKGFLSTPTKVDAAISVCCLFGGLLLAGSNTYFSKYLDERFEPYVMLCSALLLCIGVFTNVVTSLPSLDFTVPAGIARFQNLVVTFFVMGSVTRLNTALARVLVGSALLPPILLQQFSLLADLSILLGAILNCLRVRHLLKNVHHWMIDETHDGNGPSKGLLSWFKSSRSSNELSDYDSDLDDIHLESEDDSRGHSSNPRSRWSRA